MVPADPDVDRRTGIVPQAREQRGAGALQGHHVGPRWAQLIRSVVAIGPRDEVLRAAGLENGDLAVANVGADRVVGQREESDHAGDEELGAPPDACFSIPWGPRRVGPPWRGALGLAGPARGSGCKDVGGGVDQDYCPWAREVHAQDLALTQDAGLIADRTAQ